MRRADDGSTLTEAVLAAGLTLVALGMLASAVLPPLAELGRTGLPDVARPALEAAADGVARELRAARADVPGPAIVSATSGELVLRVDGDDGSTNVRVALTDGRLMVERHGDAGPEGTGVVLIGGLSQEASGFVLLGPAGAPVGDGSLATVLAVEVVLSDGSEVVRRRVALRSRRPGEGPDRW